MGKHTAPHLTHHQPWRWVDSRIYWRSWVPVRFRIFVENRAYGIEG